MIKKMKKGIIIYWINLEVISDNLNNILMRSTIHPLMSNPPERVGSPARNGILSKITLVRGHRCPGNAPPMPKLDRRR